MASHAEFSQRLDELEKKYDEQFKTVFQALRQIMYPAPTEKKEIGFRVKEKNVRYPVTHRKQKIKRISTN